MIDLAHAWFLCFFIDFLAIADPCTRDIDARVLLTSMSVQTGHECTRAGFEGNMYLRIWIDTVTRLRFDWKVGIGTRASSRGSKN